jgi:hypothetical protein
VPSAYTVSEALKATPVGGGLQFLATDAAGAFVVDARSKSPISRMFR